MEEPLTIFYTGGLRGDLALLPRLCTFLRALRAELAPAGERTLLFDLGEACVPGVWHCDATGGRSALLVLDALGYAAARADGLSAADRAKLTGNLLQLTPVDADHPWRDGSVCACALPEPGALCVVLAAAASTALDGHVLRLQGVRAGEIGAARVGPGPALLSASVHTMPASTLPDATIAAVVDFVLDEARRFAQRRNA
ncbi:MAG: hypothetical protein ACUVSX_14455 [Aggregatilineales bacterium]